MLLKTILKKLKIFVQVKDMFVKTSFLIIASNPANFFFTNELQIEKQIYQIQILSQLLPAFFENKFYSLFKTVFFYFLDLNFLKNFELNLLIFLLRNKSNFFFFYDIKNRFFFLSNFFDFFAKCKFFFLCHFIFIKDSFVGVVQSFLRVGIFFLLFLSYYAIYNTFLILFKIIAFK